MKADLYTALARIEALEKRIAWQELRERERAGAHHDDISIWKFEGAYELECGAVRLVYRDDWEAEQYWCSDCHDDRLIVARHKSPLVDSAAAPGMSASVTSPDAAAPTAAVICSQEPQPSCDDYTGRRVAVHMKTGAIDEIRGGVWEAWNHDGKALIKLDKAGKIACAADEWVLLPEGWVP